jgi:hypothetical protein
MPYHRLAANPRRHSNILVACQRYAIALGAPLCAAVLGGCALAAPPAAVHRTGTGRRGADGPPAGLPDRVELLGRMSSANGCRTRAGALPNPSCTPGAILADATLGDICRAGYAHSERPPLSYTEPIKRRDMVAYGYGGQRLSHYILDHLVPLELGGSGYSRANLWIQTLAQAHRKDTVENYLANAACEHHIELRAAQRAIARNWLEIWQRMTPAQRVEFSYGRAG